MKKKNDNSNNNNIKKKKRKSSIEVKREKINKRQPSHYESKGYTTKQKPH